MNDDFDNDEIDNNIETDSMRNDIARAAGKAVKKTVRTTASSAAAASTAGASKAAEKGAELANKVSDKLDESISSKTGVSKRKIKFTRRTTTLLFPIILIIAIFYFFITLFDYVQLEVGVNDIKAVVDEMESKLGKELIRFTDEDFKQLINAIEEKYEKNDRSSTSYLNKFVSSIDADNEKSRLNKALTLLEKYFRAEKSNFNRIKWVVVNGENDDKKTPIMYETADGLQLPKTNENYFGNGTFPELNANSTISQFKGYLQTWIIPFSLHLGTQKEVFAQDVIDVMYNEVSAQVYMLNKYTKKITYNLTLKTEPYQEYYQCTARNGVCPNGHTDHTEGTVVHARTLYKVSEPLEIISENSRIDSKIEKSPDSVAAFINYAETFRGIVSSPVKVEPKSESTYMLSQGTLVVSGTPTAEGVSGTRIDTETWRDLASQETETVVGYTLSPKKIAENLNINRVQAFLYNSSYNYDKFYFDRSTLQEPFRIINKYHKDAVTEMKSGTLIKDVWGEQGLAWPVPQCTIVGYYFHDPVYQAETGNVHEGVDISNEEKIENNHGPDVIAAADGEITAIVRGKKKGDSGYGNYVEITHSNGLVTRYAHLYNVEKTLKKGMNITEGTKLGYMGTTGNSTGIHLHFEVIQDGVRVDPMQFYLYETKKMNFNGVSNKTIKVYTGRKKQSSGNILNAQFTAEWNQKINDMIEEALEMAEIKCMVYDQSGPRTITEDIRPTTGDCSSFVANLYYRFFDHAFIGSWSGEQYNMSNLQNIKAMVVECAINPDGTINAGLIRPGDVMVFELEHTMLYVGEIGGRGISTIIEHGGGMGPNIGDFYRYSPAKRTECRVLRYYRDDALAGTSGTSLGSIPLGTAVPSSTYNAAMAYMPIVQKWSERFGLDPYLVIAMIAQESGADPYADNGSAAGLMQVEYSAGANSTQANYMDGSTEYISFSQSELYNPENNIKAGCAHLRNRMDELGNNILVGIQGYNYGPGGIKRTVCYYISGGTNTGENYCGVSDDMYYQYVSSFDTGWLAAREWYSSEGWYIFKGGPGTPNHVELVLSYYDTRGGTEYPFVIDRNTKTKVTFGN